MSDVQVLAKRPSARELILDAALRIVREQGYSATSVDDLCRAAGVTKGAFFHHFKSKEDLAVAAAKHWTQTTEAKFARAPYHQHADALDRVMAYLDFRRGLIRGEPATFSCYAGTVVQETYQTNPLIRDACFDCVEAHAQSLEADLAEAIATHGVSETAESLALHIQAVLQGAFILAKAKNDRQIAIDSIDHLRRYFEMLFNTPNREEIPS